MTSLFLCRFLVCADWARMSQLSHTIDGKVIEDRVDGSDQDDMVLTFLCSF